MRDVRTVGANILRMLRLTLQRKFFLALTVLLAALMLVFVSLSRLGLQRSLGDYVAEIELNRMDWLVLRLEQAYVQHGDWRFLQDDANAWKNLQQPQDPPSGRADDGFQRGPPPSRSFGGPGGPPPNEAGSNRPPPPPDGDRGPGGPEGPGNPDGPGGPAGGPESIYQRLALLDANAQTVLAGAPLVVAGAIRQPLHYQGRPIGYLALAPQQSTQSEAGRAFISQQLGFVLTTGLAGLLLALLISWQLARRWLAPIRQLMLGAEAVAAGRLDTQVPLRGSDELAALTQTFNDMARRLAGVDASRQRWLADVAHELRTPLAALRADIEALQDGIRPFSGATADRLHRQVMRLGQLVDDLRLTMQDDSGLPALALAPMRPLELLLDAAHGMQGRFSEAGLVLDPTGLQAMADAGKPLVNADARRLAQVFHNLLENSLKYTEAGGRVVLGATIDTTALHIDVQDSTPAPATHDLPRLFERFYRGEASRSRALGGSGLGLAICKALVEAHGGQISAQVSPLGGLWIRLDLPLVPA